MQRLVAGVGLQETYQLAKRNLAFSRKNSEFVYFFGVGYTQTVQYLLEIPMPDACEELYIKVSQFFSSLSLLSELTRKRQKFTELLRQYTDTICLFNLARGTLPEVRRTNERNHRNHREWYSRPNHRTQPPVREIFRICCDSI